MKLCFSQSLYSNTVVGPRLSPYTSLPVPSNSLSLYIQIYGQRRKVNHDEDHSPQDVLSTTPVSLERSPVAVPYLLILP